MFDYRLQKERDKMIWTDRDMWKAGIIGFIYGVIFGLLFFIGH